MGKWLNKQDNWIGRDREPIDQPEQPPDQVKTIPSPTETYLRKTISRKMDSCPYCHSIKFKVYGSSQDHRGKYSYCRCLACKRKFGLLEELPENYFQPC